MFPRTWSFKSHTESFTNFPDFVFFEITNFPEIYWATISRLIKFKGVDFVLNLPMTNTKMPTNDSKCETFPYGQFSKLNHDMIIK